MIRKKNILIYNDTGTTMNCVRGAIDSLRAVVDLTYYEIITANKEYVNNTTWETKTALFIMPGGRSKPYYSDLDGHDKGNQKIKRFVEQQQGSYFGICAGGYYGCSKTEFEVGFPLEIRCEGALNFYNGTAYGPAYGSGQFRYENNDGAKISNIALYNQAAVKLGEYKVYYNGGAFFIPHPSTKDNTLVLARYVDIPESPIAIVQCNVGDGGNVILTGIHPEFSYREVATQAYQDANIYHALKETEQERLQFFAHLIFQLGLKLNSTFHDSVY